MKKLLLIIIVLLVNTMIISCSERDTSEIDTLYQNQLSDEGGDESHETKNEDTP
ncbi:hypothetical protein [Ascidiimonas sp. W6]|uniref:hypothetical protein n=1 Tax=Ascidiimonas meishanensis TaxID=3128903 RepID=UPI0030EC2B69